MASHEAVREALAARPTAGVDQQAMVRDLSRGGQGEALVVGQAGTGQLRPARRFRPRAVAAFAGSRMGRLDPDPALASHPAPRRRYQWDGPWPPAGPPGSAWWLACSQPWRPAGTCGTDPARTPWPGDAAASRSTHLAALASRLSACPRAARGGL